MAIDDGCGGGSAPFVLRPWFFVLTCLAGWICEELQSVIRFQQAQITTLREVIGEDARLLLNDQQRRRLALAGKPLGRKMIGDYCDLFTPDTILRWHRRLVATHHTYDNAPRSVGRPALDPQVVELVLRLAGENPNWGADRIQGELRKIGLVISDTSVENILKEHGVGPSPERSSTGSWAEFLQAHWECLAATDFTTVDVWTATGLKTVYLLFVIELKSRRVQYLGSTEHPNESWMLQSVERACAPDGILGGPEHPTILIMDHDSKFSTGFKSELKAHGIESKLTAIRTPNMNAYMERFIGSYKRECANRMVFFGSGMLDRATKIYLEHCKRTVKCI